MSDQSRGTLDELVAELEVFVAELQQSIAHAMRSIDHAGNRLPARFGAHVLAAQGHLKNAQDRLDDVARSWAATSSAED